jgi:hypothetical protein
MCLLERKLNGILLKVTMGISLDSRTIAKYAVVSVIYGDYAKDTINSLPMHTSPMAQKYIPFKSNYGDYEYCLFYVLEFEGVICSNEISI